MKRLTVIIAVGLLISIELSSLSPYVSFTHIDHQIDTETLAEVDEIKNKLFEGLGNENSSLLKSIFSPMFFQNNGPDISHLMDQIRPFIVDEELTVDHMYHTKVISPQNPIAMTIIPEFTTDLLMVNSAEIYGGESFCYFLESAEDQSQYLVYLLLGKFDDNWKIHHIGIGQYKIEGMTAPMLHSYINKMSEAHRDNTAVYYALALNKCIRPVGFLQYQNEQEYIDLVQHESRLIMDLYQFPFTVGDINVIGIDIELTNTDGITPVILYLTDTELDRAKLHAELDRNLEKLKEHFFGLGQEFEDIVFRAYNEMPSSPQRQYNCYNSVIPLQGW